MALFIQSIVICLLFTLLLIPATKNPIKYLFNYPPAIQQRVKGLKEYEGLIPTRKSKLGKKLFGAFLFIVIGIGLCKIAGVNGFRNAFFHIFIIFTVVNLYDLIVLDWVIFCHMKMFQIPGTEDMDSEYKNYGFHFTGFLKGMVIGVIASLIVASTFLFL